ncbi:Flp family type IVb pilin [uncultured Mitsuokella sp.]|uniref:Flp family type IVb pilin n=1 Tax=uncultured Mitsuokella sp. TaxID=453120 RepID=UPI002598229C|nr:pilin protein [uncultured Mitsuokella sp.]
MNKNLDYIKCRYFSEKGQGIVEYALILAFVTIIAAALINAGGLQENIQAVITKVTGLLGKAQGAQ